MHRLAVIFAGVLGAALLTIPFVTSALAVPGISVGGRIITWIPCLNGNIFTVVTSAQGATLGAPIPYIWTPATITKLAGPPTHVGQEEIGLASPTLLPLCVISFVPLIILPGFPLLDEFGTSPL